MLPASSSYLPQVRVRIGKTRSLGSVLVRCRNPAGGLRVLERLLLILSLELTSLSQRVFIRSHQCAQESRRHGTAMRGGQIGRGFSILAVSQLQDRLSFNGSRKKKGAPFPTTASSGAPRPRLLRIINGCRDLSANLRVRGRDAALPPRLAPTGQPQALGAPWRRPPRLQGRHQPRPKQDRLPDRARSCRSRRR